MDTTNPSVSVDEAKAQATGFIAALFDFSFTTFITIKFVKLLYVLMLLMIALGYLIGVIMGFVMGGAGGGFAYIIFGVPLAALQVVFARIWLELIVVLFRIGENTSIMAKKA